MSGVPASIVKVLFKAFWPILKVLFKALFFIIKLPLNLLLSYLKVEFKTNNSLR